MKHFAEFVAYKIADILKEQGRAKTHKQYIEIADFMFWRLVNNFNETIEKYNLNEEELLQEYKEGRA